MYLLVAQWAHKAHLLSFFKTASTQHFPLFEPVFFARFVTNWSYSCYLLRLETANGVRLDSHWCKLERHILALSLPTGWH